MAFDPTKPVEGTPLDAAEMRGQLTALKALIDGLQTQVNAVQNQVNQAAKNPGLGEFDPGFSDPPTTADLNNIKDFINIMNLGMNW